MVKREYLVFFVLLIIVVLNTVALFTHPAYRYYKHNVDRVKHHLDARITDFEMHVSKEFLPAIYQSITNNSYSALHPDSQPSVSSSFVPLSVSTNNISRSRCINAHYFTVGDKSYLDFDGFYLRVGDNLDGSPITSISPYAVTTRLNFYELQKSNFQPQVTTK